MPELPEVETVRQTLRKLILNKKITDVTVLWENIVKLPLETEAFRQELKGQTVREINRKGKFLIVEFDDIAMVSHLRMEGKYGVYPAAEPRKKHTHVIFQLDDGTELRYNDVRKFGTMHLFKKGEERHQKPLALLGPDPFDSSFTLDYFYNRLQKTQRSIKAVLLDQSIVAGLGNIYVDETLFRSGIHPERKANTLTSGEVDKVRIAAIETLQEAVEQGGTTIRSYVNSQGQIGMFQQRLFVYGKVEEPCQQCGAPIEKIRVSNRGTHFCRNCQQ
ncbi:formamidopyrimidine-DNA glycosylase [Thalassobacillus devorans]|uniref:Formamidopyrimidine-DNA glycosylase n=1 Tax=Thalassobacillus devorans TaxID=279813 RepID=A0ABQ1P9E7_9BACI|nr:DNA-formamidopyrimidine glycosylase [Thalassobacillus devorans]NIK29875.1 formamidopyrimidine-DNA glycosylase [Thalassobacillus devorans]GGC93543.1 formamidopyrimidine-DNA glycosylase [Thalassobacillus devorans]